MQLDIEKATLFAVEDHGCCIVDGEEIHCARGTCLFSAAAHGHARTVQVLLGSTSWPTSTTRTDLDAALHIAAANAAVDVMDVLLKAGAEPDVDIQYKQDYRTRTDAAKLRPTRDCVHTPGRNFTAAYRCRALHLAAASGQVRAVELLLQSGASPQAVDSRGATALHFAARCGHVEVLQVLLNAGIPVGAVELLLHSGASRQGTGSSAALRCPKWTCGDAYGIAPSWCTSGCQRGRLLYSSALRSS